MHTKNIYNKKIRKEGNLNNAVAEALKIQEDSSIQDTYHFVYIGIGTFGVFGSEAMSIFMELARRIVESGEVKAFPLLHLLVAIQLDEQLAPMTIMTG